MGEKHRNEVLEALKPIELLIDEIKAGGIIPSDATSNLENVGVSLHIRRIPRQKQVEMPPIPENSIRMRCERGKLMEFLGNKA